ncbi:hypothetical protein QTO34_018535 [Cnephaeus nilssonii]|uniref:NF-kappa-B inhibitor-like protein 1 n=1 Tax=Cnephaeus nilssonii TaxID=3371016 RepID=A0AA40HYZ9_CNENI|nr:hypothetical protein QTO34_018535 [Eptesicus nilssonii]
MLDSPSLPHPSLHRACARHDAPALYLLLWLSADPAYQDGHGNTVPHTATHQGPDAYTELLSLCYGNKNKKGEPSRCCSVNKNGETPRQILGWGLPWDSTEEEEEEVHRKHEWRQKLQGELEDEWQEVIGQLQTMFPMRPRNLSPSQPEVPATAGGKGTLASPQAEGRRRTSGSLESEPRAKEEELHKSQTSRPRSRHRRLTGTQSPRPSTPDKQGGAASGTLVTCPGPALGERTSQIETWKLGCMLGEVTILSQVLNHHTEALK